MNKKKCPKCGSVKTKENIPKKRRIVLITLIIKKHTKPLSGCCAKALMSMRVLSRLGERAKGGNSPFGNKHKTMPRKGVSERMFFRFMSAGVCTPQGVCVRVTGRSGSLLTRRHSNLRHISPKGYKRLRGFIGFFLNQFFVDFLDHFCDFLDKKNQKNLRI